MSLIDLRGQTIMLSGACGALGLPISKVLVDHGARLVLLDRISQEQALERFQQHQIRQSSITYKQLDLSSPDEVNALFDKLSELPDVVCCHAGLTRAEKIEDYPLADFDRLMDINLRSAFVLAQKASQQWLAAGQSGHLIFTTSWVQDVPWPEITPYNVSKAGLKTLMRGFARELAPRGIRANAIAPGIVAAGMALKQLEEEPAYKARAEKAIPLGYLQSPESVAHAFLFLCSPLSSYMTGSVLLVDGGASLYPMDV